MRNPTLQSDSFDQNSERQYSRLHDEKTLSYDQNSQRRQSRLRSARSTNAEHVTNKAHNDPKINSVPRKNSVKKPGILTNPSAINDSKSKLQQRRAATNNSNKENGEDQGSYIKDAANATVGSKLLIPGKVIAIAIQARKDINDHQKTPWFLLIALALAIDFLDLIPIFGWFFARMISLFLFITLLGRGRWIKKYIWKLVVALFIKFIPIINMIPSTTLVVVWIHHDSEKAIKKGAEILKETKKAVPELSV